MKRRQRQTRLERGATAVEYGLLLALIAAVIVVAVTTTGSKVLDLFTSVNWWL